MNSYQYKTMFGVAHVDIFNGQMAIDVDVYTTREQAEDVVAAHASNAVLTRDCDVQVSDEERQLRIKLAGTRIQRNRLQDEVAALETSNAHWGSAYASMSSLYERERALRDRLAQRVATAEATAESVKVSLKCEVERAEYWEKKANRLEDEMDSLEERLDQAVRARDTKVIEVDRMASDFERAVRMNEELLADASFPSRKRAEIMKLLQTGHPLVAIKTYLDASGLSMGEVLSVWRGEKSHADVVMAHDLAKGRSSMPLMAKPEYA